MAMAVEIRPLQWGGRQSPRCGSRKADRLSEQRFRGLVKCPAGMRRHSVSFTSFHTLVKVRGVGSTYRSLLEHDPAVQSLSRKDSLKAEQQSGRSIRVIPIITDCKPVSGS